MNTTEIDKLEVKALAPWYGSNRENAHRVGELLEGCEWVGIPFLGSGAEIPYITARAIVANDLHRLMINLCRVVSDRHLGPQLYRELRRDLFHVEELETAQEWCHDFGAVLEMDTKPNLGLALNYFKAVWMGRSANAGTKQELKGQLPIRWNAGGGGSAVRFHSAVRSLPAWRRAMRRCEFSTFDFRAFLAKCHDAEKHGIYCDPPFIGPGDRYLYTMSGEDHVALRNILSQFAHSRIVCRFYDIPIIRELYDETTWQYITFESRKQSNDIAQEVLLVRN